MYVCNNDLFCDMLYIFEEKSLLRLFSHLCAFLNTQNKKLSYMSDQSIIAPLTQQQKKSVYTHTTEPETKK